MPASTVGSNKQSSGHRISASQTCARIRNIIGFIYGAIENDFFVFALGKDIFPRRPEFDITYDNHHILRYDGNYL